MKLVLALLALFVAPAALAQQTFTFTSSNSSGNGTLTTTLTWASNSGGCMATGTGFAGSKPASGSQTITINSSRAVGLTCTWGGNTTISWVAPTTNTDGSALTNLAGFRLYYGTSSSSLSNTLTVNDVTARSAPVDGLSPGTWYFGVRAFNSAGVESVDSNIATKAVTGTSQTRSLNLTVTPIPTVPSPPTGVTVIERTAYDVVPNFQKFVFERGRRVGEAKIGAACDGSRPIGDGFYAVARPSTVNLTRLPRSSAIVAKCG